MTSIKYMRSFFDCEDNMINIIIGPLECSEFNLIKLKHLFNANTNSGIFIYNAEERSAIQNIFNKIYNKDEQTLITNALIYNLNSWVQIDELKRLIDELDEKIQEKILSQLHFYCRLNIDKMPQKKYYELKYDEMLQHLSPFEIITQRINKSSMLERIVLNEEIIFGV